MNTEAVVGIIGAVIGGGGIAGWIRERRRARKDAYNFALELLEQQNSRIDGLIMEVGTLKGQVERLEAENTHLRQLLSEGP